ncbi:MAG: hypothetical protein PHU59_03995 [Candidatus Omnitrophica bacterium]|nr:hypothetical protein [Candidatus Omnitrophota bacterium]
MKILKRIILGLGIIFIALVILSLASFLIIKNLKIKDIVEQEIERTLGINVTINKFEFSPLLAHIGLSGITVHNPDGFAEDELAYIEAIHLVFDPLEIITLKKPNIYVFAMDLKRLNIIKNAQGKVNIEEIFALKADNVVQDKNIPFYFDIVVLSIGEVTYLDHAPPGKKEQKYLIGLKDAAFVNLPDEKEIVKIVVMKAIENTDIGKLINLKIIPVVSQLGDTFDSAWGTAKTASKGAWSIATLPFHLLFK